MGNHWEIVAAGEIKVHDNSQQLWENACKYFKWCDNNPLVTKRVVTQGKATGLEANKTNIRPYNIKALCLHCGILEEYLNDCFTCDDKGNEYYLVASRIYYSIYSQNLEYGISGEFNPIIIAKILNLEKPQEVETRSITVNVVASESGKNYLARSENEVLEKLELENQARELLKEQKADRVISTDGAAELGNTG